MEDSKIRKDIQHQDMNSNVRYFLKYFVVCIIGKIFIFVYICILGKIFKYDSCPCLATEPCSQLYSSK